MKKIPGLTLLMSCLSTLLYAQDSIVIDKEEATSWFQQNWMWVVGAVVLIILIAALSGGGSRDRKKIKTTTVSKDNYGNVNRVTTEETEIS